MVFITTGLVFRGDPSTNIHPENEGAGVAEGRAKILGWNEPKGRKWPPDPQMAPISLRRAEIRHECSQVIMAGTSRADHPECCR